MEKKYRLSKWSVIGGLLFYLLLFCLTSCKKDKNETPEEAKTDNYSSAYGKWRLIAIENGFLKTEKAPDFDCWELNQPGNYEITKNGIIIGKGTVLKDTTSAVSNFLNTPFIPDPSSSVEYITPKYRYLYIKNDTLTIFCTLDTEYSYRFVRSDKWIPKSSEGFHIQTGNVIVLESNEIDYYDGSANLIYLKDKNSLIKRLSGALMDVYVDNEIIYPLVIYPMTTSSYSPNGANIMSWPSTFPANVLFINYSNSGGFTDKRGDSRIIESLRKQGKYHD